jgi:hypothetical protein
MIKGSEPILNKSSMPRSSLRLTRMTTCTFQLNNGNTAINNYGTFNTITAGTFQLSVNPSAINNYSGAVFSAHAATFQLSGGNCTINNTGTFTVYATSTMQLSGNPSNITNNSGGIFTATGTTFTLNGGNSTIVNTGNFNSSASSSYTLSGADTYLQNNSGGTFTDNGSTFTISSGNADNQINNAGTFSTTSSTITMTKQSCNVTNSGIFNATSTTLDLYGPGGGNYVYLSNSGTFSGSAVTIQTSNNDDAKIINSGTFTANNGSAITLASDADYIQNTGTFYAGTSNSACIITLGGGHDSYIVNTGASGANANFYVGSTSGLLLPGAGGQDYENYVTNTSNAYSFFTFQSDAFGTGYIGAIGSADFPPTSAYQPFNGTFTVQRYLTGGAGYRGYRLISSPVYTATVAPNNVFSINYLQNSTYLTGNAGGGFDKTGNPTLYLYRESVTPSNVTFISGNFFGISAINNATAYNYYVNGGATNYNLPVGNGVMFFFRGNRASAVVGVETVPGYVPVTVTLSTSGTLNLGQVILHDWYTPASAYLGYTGVGTGTNFAVRGFNLAGNPYASSIDWETYNTVNSTNGIYAHNVGNTIYVLDPATNNYDTYQKGGAYTNHGTRTIVSGQGFFVSATNSTTPQLIFNETAKTATQNTGLNLLMALKTNLNAANTNSANVDQHLRLKMAMDSINTDDIYIGFDQAASTQFVDEEDAPYKAGNGQVKLASFSSDNVRLAINKMPLPGTKQTTIPLFVTAKAYGTYTLSLSELTGVPQLFDIWLMDRYNKDSLDMRHNSTYTFDITTDTNSYGDNRFQLVMRQNPALGLHLLNFTANKATNGVLVGWVTENEQNYTNFSVERSSDGGTTFDALGGFGSSTIGTYSFLDKNPPAATVQYRLKIQDLNGAITYSNVITLIYGAGTNAAASSINVYPNPASNTISLSISQNNNAGTLSPVSALQTNSFARGLASAPTGGGQQAYDIKIVNITGSVVANVSSASVTWQNDVSNLSPGTYVIKVTNSKSKSIVGQATFVKL